MQIYPCLASVAQIEFDALVQDTQRVIEGLDRQRQSATQAIEATRRASEEDESQPLETTMVELELLDKLRRLGQEFVPVCLPCSTHSRRRDDEHEEQKAQRECTHAGPSIADAVTSRT